MSGLGSMRPEDAARQNIDRMLAEAGRVVQDRKDLDVSAGRGAVIRYFPLENGEEADYLLFVDQQWAGVIEAKPEGTALSGVAAQCCLGNPDCRSLAPNGARLEAGASPPRRWRLP